MRVARPDRAEPFNAQPFMACAKFIWDRYFDPASEGKALFLIINLIRRNLAQTPAPGPAGATEPALPDKLSSIFRLL